MGIATTRSFERSAMLRKQLGNAVPVFESNQSVIGAGVLFILPALLSSGLLKAKDVYTIPENHYYGLESVLLVLAFMSLSRIKNPEQLEKCKPGEIGRIVGLDRSPEAKCLRNKIKLLADQKKAAELNRILIDEWYKTGADQDGSFLYIDGHQRIYFGSKANLPVKYISRQKLCLAATTEYWVNDEAGLPVLVVTGELTEKLEQAIEEMIIPELEQTNLLPNTVEKTSLVPSEDSTHPNCTLIFDREGYHPVFFKRLWEEKRIAVITYRKNVRDLWNDNLFIESTVRVLENEITMYIHEQEIELDGVKFREVRRRNSDKHQTSIITTNYHIPIEQIAGRMFGRWSQENFFKYMISDYDFDKMISYGVESVEQTKTVVNPLWRRADYAVKKQAEKTSRLKAKMYSVAEEIAEGSIEKIPKLTNKQMLQMEKILEAKNREEALKTIRAQHQHYIQVENMEAKYDKLKPESKLMLNIIKMICYRAETAIANLLASFLPQSKNKDKRTLTKLIIEANADLVVDEKQKTLTVQLHSLATNRYNEAAGKLAALLNQTETIFPGTDLRLIFKNAAI